MKKAFLLGLLFFAVDASAAVGKWTIVRSANVTVMGDATESQLRNVAVEVEQFRAAFMQVLTSPSQDATLPLNVVVFKGDDTFNVFKPLNDNNPGNKVFFQASDDVDYMAMVAGATIPRAVYHQLAHELSRDLPNTVPLWFTEGLAEFFSDFQIVPKDKTFVVGKIIPDHVDLLKKSPFMPFDELFSVNRASTVYNESTRKGAFYAQSWAFVNYLLTGLNGSRQKELAEFLKLINEGQSSQDAFQKAFKTDYKSMLGELDYYVREKANWPGSAAALKDRNEIEKQLKTKSLTDAEAEFYSADLLLHQMRVNEAEAHLKQAITSDPKLSDAQAAMGMLRFKQDRLPEAIEYLKRATELDPKNYMSQYDYAYVLDKNSNSPLDDIDAKRAALGKAIDLMPQYEPAYELLAYVNITADIDYNGTIELLQKAYKLAPGNANIRFLLAQALVKKEEFKEAERLLNTLVNNAAVTPALRDGAHTLSNYIAGVNAEKNKVLETETENARRDEEAAKAANAARTPDPMPVAAATPVAEAPPASSAARPKSGELISLAPQKPKVEGTQIKGMLTLVDCRGGLTLTVKSGSDTLKLHSDTPDKIQFVSYVASVNAALACGPASGQGIPVVITYRPTPGGSAQGEPLMVEFVEP